MNTSAVRPATPPVLRVLAFGALLLAALLVAAFALGQRRWQPPPALAPDASALAVRTLPPAVAVDNAAAQLAARPLFAATRRPPPQESVADESPDAHAETAAAEDALAAFSLIGVIGSGASSVALLAGPDGQRRLRLGGQLEGWSLSLLDARGATFVQAVADNAADAVREQRLPFVRIPRERIGQPPRPQR